MTKLSKNEIRTIITQASELARQATETMISQNPDTWYPCGFAWVRIKPARGPFVSVMKEMNLGSSSELGGYVVYNPSNNATQWMDAKAAGARAFALELNKYGVKANVEQRMD